MTLILLTSIIDHKSCFYMFTSVFDLILSYFFYYICVEVLLNIIFILLAAMINYCFGFVIYLVNLYNLIAVLI